VYQVIANPLFSEVLDRLLIGSQNGNGESRQLLKLIEKGVEKLKYDYRYGDHIKYERIPKEYFTKFNVDNLWKLNLGSFWRMIYTVRGKEIEVISIVLEVLDHKEYDRKFGYRTS
jgi:hypothetical protein